MNNVNTVSLCCEFYECSRTFGIRARGIASEPLIRGEGGEEGYCYWHWQVSSLLHLSPTAPSKCFADVNFILAALKDHLRFTTRLQKWSGWDSVQDGWVSQGKWRRSGHDGSAEWSSCTRAKEDYTIHTDPHKTK